MLEGIINKVLQENQDIKITLDSSFIAKHIKGHEKRLNKKFTFQEIQELVLKIFRSYNIYGKN